MFISGGIKIQTNLMSENIYITGIGVNSAIGLNVEENLESLISGKSGISSIQFLESNHKLDYVAGEVKLSNEQLAARLNIQGAERHPRTGLLAILAAQEAYKMARLETISPLRIGFIGGTTVGGMDKTEKHYLHAADHPEFILTHSSGYISELVANTLNIQGYLSTLNTACSSSTNAIITAARAIKHGHADVIIAGGFDSLSKFTLNGFKTLMILSPEACKPFDKNRQGLNLGEGAGFVVLESEKSMRARNIKPLAKLAGSANTNDAYHQTASSPDGMGAYLSMKKALQRASLNPNNIDYINVHGTGTSNNDLTEGVAIKRLYKDNIPELSSTKAYTGHTLGAAGGIEAVYSILALQNNVVFPNLRFREMMPEVGITPTTRIIHKNNVKHVMSNSFGFGGNDSTVIFSDI